ncbi:hypothetical protein EVAR_24287_1 [Eumeta japonica]|uniref:Uncharacterized protein n=1 Tax=Eumeta variegata TaxID=151549 RepID=A0A4C1VHD3_EUMVA|nr:hypothetical protein EVAR_24287_1 [Eumeta japonica]
MLPTCRSGLSAAVCARGLCVRRPEASARFSGEGSTIYVMYGPLYVHTDNKAPLSKLAVKFLVIHGVGRRRVFGYPEFRLDLVTDASDGTAVGRCRQGP